MSEFLSLIYEFFKVGLFSVGGGNATIPFLADMGERTGWFTTADLMNMLAVSESTPGPIGINTATYVGYSHLGIPGGVVSTLSEVAPAIIVIFIIARMLQKFRSNRYVDYAFYGLRAGSAALITSAFLTIAEEVIFRGETFLSVNVKALILIPIIWLFSNKVKLTKDLHPICFILAGAAAGIVFHFAA